MTLDDLHKPAYIGDSVYCGWLATYFNMLVIGTCNDGRVLQNVIYLEPEVVDNLINFAKKGA